MVTWDEARELALALPEAEESTWHGTPAFRVAGDGFARLRKLGGDEFAIRVGFDEKEFLARAKPDAFFQHPHYEGYPWIVARLSVVERDDLRDALTEAWLAAARPEIAMRYDPPPDHVG